jgi:hypothetical protein
MSGVTKEGILQTTTGGGAGGNTKIEDGAGVAGLAQVLNTAPAGTEYGLAVRLIGASGGGGPATIADGADVNAGATTDAAITTDTTGTLSGKLRGLVKWAFERMPTSLGQKLMTGSLPVVIASDQSSVAVTGPLTDAQLRASAVPISAASLPLPTGAATEATLATRAADRTTAASPFATRLSDGAAFYKATTPTDTQPISAVSLPLPTGAATETTLSTRLADATFTGRINTLGQKTSANSTPVVLSSDYTVPVTGPLTDAQLRATPVPVSGPLTDAQLRASSVLVNTKFSLTPASPTVTTVGNVSGVAVAANVNRKGLTLVNTSNNIISLGFGATAVAGSGVTLYPGGVFNMGEYDFYTGAVNAIANVAFSSLAIQEYT